MNRRVAIEQNLTDSSYVGTRNISLVSSRRIGGTQTVSCGGNWCTNSNPGAFLNTVILFNACGWSASFATVRTYLELSVKWWTGPTCLSCWMTFECTTVKHFRCTASSADNHTLAKDGDLRNQSVHDSVQTRSMLSGLPELWATGRSEPSWAPTMNLASSYLHSAVSCPVLEFVACLLLVPLLDAKWVEPRRCHQGQLGHDQVVRDLQRWALCSSNCRNTFPFHVSRLYSRTTASSQVVAMRLDSGKNVTRSTIFFRAPSNRVGDARALDVLVPFIPGSGATCRMPGFVRVQ